MARVKAPGANPWQTEAANQMRDQAIMAERRAAENDQFYRENILPRVMDNMDRQYAMGRELQDFSMGLARRNQAESEKSWKYNDQLRDYIDAYNTEDNRSRMAGEAMGDVTRAFDASDAQGRRRMYGLNINPNSGMAMAMERRTGVDRALASAQAATSVRQAAEREGVNLKAMGAGLGANFGAGAMGWAGMVPGAGAMGNSALGFAQNSINSNNASWGNTMGMANQGWGQLGNWGQAQNAMAYDAKKSNAVGTNQLIGKGIGWGMQWATGGKAGN